MEKDIIIQREEENDGTNVHLYFHEPTGMYVGYGPSAYFSTSVVDPIASFSETMNMPVVFLTRKEILLLRQCMTIQEHKQHCYYHFRTRDKIGTRWYQTWIGNIRKT